MKSLWLRVRHLFLIMSYISKIIIVEKMVLTPHHAIRQNEEGCCNEASIRT